jgi:hypothetical protein
MSALHKFLIEELTGSKSGIEQARSWLVQHPDQAAAAVELLLNDLANVSSYARCLNVLCAHPTPPLPPQCCLCLFLGFRCSSITPQFIIYIHSSFHDSYLINDVVHYCKRKEGDTSLASVVAQFEVH